MQRKLKYKIPTSGSPASGYLPPFDDDSILSVSVWKQAQDALPQQGVVNQKYLYGELSLPKDLVPSFSFGVFEVKACHVY